MNMKIITLLTDFGSFYPAQMKGVILKEVEDVTFVDIAHDIPPQDVRAGAFALLSTVLYFPRGTIHLAVVDPGVGTKRLPLAIESGGQFFVGPDNGLLIPAARSLAPPRTHSIALKLEASNTFHGRDVFAPVAAMIAKGKPLDEIGPRVVPKDLSFGTAKKTDGGIEAQVIYVDKFGNVILNMQKLPKGPVSLKGVRLRQVATYADVKRIEPLITIGSHGFVEVAVNGGSAKDAFSLQAGDLVLLEDVQCR